MSGRTLLIFLSFPVIAQVESSNLSISGAVVDSVTGEPVKNALVSVTRMSTQPERASARTRRNISEIQKTTMTGVAGEFQIDGLAPGQYQINLQKPGFQQELNPEAFQRRTLELNTSAANVQFKLVPLGVIEGRVLDQYGDPVRGVMIHAIQVNIQDGYRRLHVARNMATDDRGAFRLWNLNEGKYYLKAAGRSGGTYRYVGDGKPAVTSAWESFAPVYSNGARDIAGADALTITPGMQATADLKVELQPAYQIRGTISGLAGNDSVTFELLQGDGDSAPYRASFNTGSNKFEIHDATEGTYTLRVKQGTLRGEIQISVKGGDLEGLVVELAPGVDVKLIQHLPPAPARPDFSSDEIQDVSAMMRRLPVNCTAAMTPLQSVDSAIVFQPERAGGWIAKNVFPGQYRVHASCIGGYPIAVVAGSTNLMLDTLTIQPGVTPAAVEISAVAGGGFIKGQIEGVTVRQGAGVLVIPGPVMQPVFGREFPGSQSDSTFLIPFLPPGDYTLYAFEKSREIAFRDPEFLKSLTGGVRVHVNDKEQQEVTLKGFVK